MGKMILVSGSNGSGKSAFAESLVDKTVGERYYIATMVAQTEDNRTRIEKHRRQREHLNFMTLEIPYGIESAPITPDSVVLLEDASNLLANAVFDHGKSAGAVHEAILALAAKCRLLIVVTISGLSADGYDDETAAYIRALELLNQWLADSADAVVELRDGIPMWQKGERDRNV